MNDPSKQVNSQYETLFLAFKGDARFFKRLGGDVLVGDPPPASNRLHPNEKNLEVSEILIDACTVHGENVLDPFAGSGVHGEAALMMERNCHLIELDREFADRIMTRVEAISQMKVATTETPNLVLPTSPDGAGIAPTEEVEQFDQSLFDS
jgi:DNA modification methylase